MDGMFNFYMNHATAELIALHLQACDQYFIPTLSTRLIDLESYSSKIANRATCFEAWVDNILIGLAAIYCNDQENKVAFLSNVSVLPNWQGKGIASQLIEFCLDHVRALGFSNIELEVDPNNKVAMQLYKKYGFSIRYKNSKSVGMYLAIGEKNAT